MNDTSDKHAASGEVKVVHAHQLVANTAMEMANVLYDQMMEDNAMYKAWKDKYYAPTHNISPKAAKFLRDKFVELYWASCITPARATLAAMLTGPYDDDYKQEIDRALILDMTLIKGRQKGLTAKLH